MFGYLGASLSGLGTEYCVDHDSWAGGFALTTPTQIP